MSGAAFTKGEKLRVCGRVVTVIKTDDEWLYFRWTPAETMIERAAPVDRVRLLTTEGAANPFIERRPA